MNKRKLISIIIIIILTTIVILFFINRETSYTFIDNVSSKDPNSLTMEFTLYEYTDSNEEVDSHTFKSKRGLHKKFKANEQTKKIKVSFLLGGTFNRWIDKVYYIKKGSNTNIKVNGDDEIREDEP
jgi:hypothetical protein